MAIGQSLEYFGADMNAPSQNSKIMSIAQLRNYGVSGPAGTTSYTPEGITQSGPGADAYADLLGLSRTAAGNAAAVDQHTGDINSIIANLFQNGGQSANATQANELGLKFGKELEGFDVNNKAGTYTDILNRMALPAEQQAAAKMGSRLFASGRTGSNDTTGGRAAGELATQQSIAQDSRSMSAYQLADQQFNRLSQATQNFGNLGSTLTSQNIANFGKIAAMPGAIQQGYIANANSAIEGANNALDPMDAQMRSLFQGATMSGKQKEMIATNLAAKAAANKANGADAGWGGALSGAMSGAMSGFAAGGPWGALAGGVAGGASGYFSSPAPAGGGQQPGGMSSGFGDIFSMFGKGPTSAGSNSGYGEDIVSDSDYAAYAGYPT